MAHALVLPGAVLATHSRNPVDMLAQTCVQDIVVYITRHQQPLFLFIARTCTFCAFGAFRAHWV